ncbi:MAG: hypothetical protein AAGA58_17330 [Verrucomicrobiota bacterium]
MNPSAPIPDIEPLIPPELAESGWPPLYYILIGLGVLLVVLFVIGLLFRKPKQRQRKIEVRKDPREVALDVLHRLKEEHLRLPAHELAARAQPAFDQYIESRLSRSGIEWPSDTITELDRLREECRLLRFSRTPEADGRRQNMIESLLQFVRDDPFERKENADPVSHSAAA